MARTDVGFHFTSDVEHPQVTMVPLSKEACEHFKKAFEMPEDYDGIDVGDYNPLACIETMPRHFVFGACNKPPKKIFKYLFYP